MSIQFSDTINKKGLVQFYEKETGRDYGDVSGNTVKLKEFTAYANLAFDRFVYLALRASGTWQFDDSNHTDYPIMYTDIVSGQRDYPFVTDGSGNVILDVYKVFIKDTLGTYIEINPIDVQSESGHESLTDGTNPGGVPFEYDKTGNGIFLTPLPDYNSSQGIKVYINREPSYFTYTDTTKKAGVPGVLHEYFFKKPAFDYAGRNNLATAVKLQNDVLSLEQQIERHFAKRERDVESVLTGAKFNFR